MFWRVSGLNTASPIDTILDKEHYTLEDLLDEDELIQECKSLNARLTTFLKHRETVEKLVTFLVEEPPPEADPKRQFKYPFAACEIFCCEVEGVFNTLLESDELLDRLFSLLRRPRPLNSMLAGYFARVVASLLLRRSADVMHYLQRRQELLAGLVHHVDTTSVAEVLARLVGADDPRGYPTPGTLNWLAGTDLPQQLAEQLGPGAPTEAQANAAEVLAAVARSASSPLTKCLASPEFMERLVDRALAPHEGRAATHALNVCIALLEPPVAAEAMQQQGMQPDAAVVDVHERLRAEAIRCVSAAAGRLVALLHGGGDTELRTSYGLVCPPVGQLRLKAVDLLAALLRTGDPGAESAVMQTRGVQLAMELFVRYPFNNALHGGVAALLTAFEPGSEALRGFLLHEARLADWLVEAPEQVTPVANPDDPRSGTRPPMRAGYCGHVTQVANRLLHLADSSQSVRSFLATHEGWQAFVRERLEYRNKLESVFAWQCGRPGAHGVEGDGEGALYGQGDASVDFSSMEGSVFSRDVYQRYGVYDQDEEGEEDQTAATDWAMDLPGAGAQGKLHQPAPRASSDSSGSDSDGDEPSAPSTLSAAAAEAGVGDSDLVVVSSWEEHDVEQQQQQQHKHKHQHQRKQHKQPDGGTLAAVAAADPVGHDDMADMRDDAVLLEFDTGEGAADLHLQLEERLTLSGMDSSTADAAGASHSPTAGTGAAAAARATPAAPPNESAAESALPAGGTVAARQELRTDSEAEAEGRKEFNANIFWKPTFAVGIEDEEES